MKECPDCHSCFDDREDFCPRDRQPLQFSFECDTILGGRYQLERRLGKGGMGTVFKAKHKFIKTLHAIKIISPDVVKLDETLLLRFHQEAVLAASIRHPNVVSVTDYGVENNQMPYLVMEFIDGISLTDFLELEKRLSPEKTYEILSQICLGLAEAHKRGIVHRDLKPLNVMLKNGSPNNKGVKVLDFGLAKIKASESYASLIQAKTTNVLGSPLYMSPEQWSNENIDHRADIYSIGVMLFQMLAGETPFSGGTLVSLMYKHLQNPPPTFASLGVAVPSEIEAVVRRALAKDRDERPLTVEAFLSEYEQALAKIGAKPVFGAKTEENLDLISSPSRTVTNKSLEIEPDSNYVSSFLTSRENEAINTFLNLPKTAGLSGKEYLAEEFIQAQNRVEAARSKAIEAEKLALELAEAQRAAEEAKQKALQAQQKLEEEARRRIQAEMEEKLALEREAREKAEAEAGKLLEEVKARKEAEEKAKASAQTALEAQQRAEIERRKAEKEAEQRQIEERTRREAEQAAQKLAEEAAEAKRKYENAKKEAEAEAYRRFEAERKRQKIEEEFKRSEEYEAEQKRIVEAQIKEQAARLEKKALEAETKAQEARRLIENEAKKREQAEAARVAAEKAALKLAEEAAEAKRKYEDAKKEAEIEALRRLEAEQKRRKIEEEIRQTEAVLAEQRKIAETEAARQIKEQAARLEKQAFDAEQKAGELRYLVENEAQKRQAAEAARVKAEEEARRLAAQIIEAQKRLEEMQQFAESEARKREQETAARRKAEDSARALSEKIGREETETKANPFQNGGTSPILKENTFPEIIYDTNAQIPSETTSATNRFDAPEIVKSNGLRNLVLAAVALVFVSGASFGAYQLFKSNGDAANNNANARESTFDREVNNQKTPETNSSNAPSQRISGKMVKITGGTFQMGRNDVAPSEGQFYGAQFPAHTVAVEEFYLDRTEVTNEEFAEFVAATKHAAPEHWRGGKPAEEQKKLPVVNVSYFDARDFAEWISRRDNVPCRLPTEEEWEYAARGGSEQNIYPWGNDWTPNRVNIASGVLKAAGASDDVTSLWQIRDMMGNVVEWTSSPFNYFDDFPENLKDARYKNSGKFTLRGLSFSKEGSALNKNNLNFTYRQPASGGIRQNFIGFRLACRSK